MISYILDFLEDIELTFNLQPNYQVIDSINFKLQVATFAPWIKCIKENAEAGHSHVDVDRNCYYTIKQFDAVPFNFEEKVNVVKPPQKREDKCDPKKAKKNF